MKICKYVKAKLIKRWSDTSAVLVARRFRLMRPQHVLQVVGLLLRHIIFIST